MRDLVDGGGASAGGGGGVAAGVARVPDVGVVGAHRGATGGAGDDAAHSEPGSAGTVGQTRLAGALCGAVAGPYRAGGTAAHTFLIGKLHDTEQRELPYRYQFCLKINYVIY